MPAAKYARSYLQNDRSLSAETISKFQVGYNPKGRSLCNEIEALGRDPGPLMSKTGLDYFGGYIVFPILKGQKAVSATSRFPGSHSFRNHLHLAEAIPIVFNWNAINEPTIYVVEAPICAMSMYQAGLNAVAVLGAYATGKRLLSSGVNPEQRVILVPDNDQSGNGFEMAVSGAAQLWEAGIHNLYIIKPEILAPFKDINQILVEKGADFISKLIIGKEFPIDRLPEFQMKLEKAREITNIQPHYELSQSEEKGNIIELLSRYGQIKKSGNRFIMCCPIHGENNASLVIYPETNTWFCFGCRRGGGARQFKAFIGEFSR